MSSYRPVNTSDHNYVQSFDVGANDSNESVRFKRYKMIKNKMCGTLALCMFGVVLFIVGLYWLAIGRKGSLPFLFLGTLSLLPGSYGAYEVHFAVW